MCFNRPLSRFVPSHLAEQVGDLGSFLRYGVDAEEHKVTLHAFSCFHAVGKLLYSMERKGYNKETVLMRQRITALTKLERHAIVLVVFVFLFGFAYNVGAISHLCSQAAGSGWKTADFTCQVVYEDTGGSGLEECQYRLWNVDLPGWTTAWLNATGTCEGESVTLTVTVTVGDTGYCAEDGQGSSKCQLDLRAEDNAGNVTQCPDDFAFCNVAAPNFNVDYQAPTTNIACNSVSCLGTWYAETVSVSLSCADPHSGCDITQYCIGSACVPSLTYSVPFDLTTSGTHIVRFRSLDTAGNTEITKEQIVTIDLIAPNITAFSVDGTSCTGAACSTTTVIINGDPSIAWTTLDTGESHLKQIEVWRAWDANGDGILQGSEWDDSSPTAGTQPNPVFTKTTGFDTLDTDDDVFINSGLPEGTYWYGVHTVDNANNCIDEATAHCGGVSSDSLDPSRTVRGPIKLIKDITPPNTTITSNPPNPSFSSSASFSFTSPESGTFECQLDGGGFSSCTSPKNYSGLSEASHTFDVQATDLAGNTDPTPASYTWNIILNQAPTISTVSDTPDPIKAAAQITFTANWSDPDGDSVTFYVCKNNTTPSGGDCSGGAVNRWCRNTTPVPSGTDATCNPTYTTQAADEGTNNYFAFVCDTSDLCSSSSSGAFLVDATDPSISIFTATPAFPAWINNAAPNGTVSWSVSDAGGSNLQQIEVWRAFDINGNGVLDTVSPNEWDDPGNEESNPISTKTTGFTTLSTDTDSYIDTNLLATASYWYGLHVLDNANNPTVESTPQRIQVDKQNPTAVVTDPAPGTWYRDNFTATFDDSDLGSGLAASCEYEFIGLNPGGPDTTSGTLTRLCNLDTKTIGVGPNPEVCEFEGINRCRVRTQAFDLAGNTSGWQSFDFSVDFTDPVVGTPAPSTAQAGVSQNYSSSLSDPVGKVASCTFFWRLVGNPEWNTGGATTIIPLPCENGEACTVSVDHTFASPGSYDVSFSCTDFTLPSPGNTGWGFGVVTVDSLSVTLSAIPSSGITTTNFDLSSQVAGTASGSAGFKFDCTNDSLWEYEVTGIDLSVSDPGWVLRNGFNTRVTAPDIFAVQDLCIYASPSTYTANTQVDRGSATAQDTVSIVVTVNTAPQAINLAHNNATTDYCFVSAPDVTLSWTFSDPNPGDSQSAYQVQVATDAGFTNIVDDEGKVTSSNSEYTPVGLLYATTYHWRVKVWDSFDQQSSPEWATGPFFTTPVHAYPTTDFAWVPVFPSAEEEIQFTDQTVYDPSSTGQSWSWDFGDTATSTLQNPLHIYAVNGAYLVTFQATDDAGTCTDTNTVNVTLPFPEWQEISPF